MSQENPAAVLAPSLVTAPTSPSTQSMRYITTHDKMTGLAVFETSVSANDTPPYQTLPFGGFSLLYTATPLPIDTTNGNDLAVYQSHIAKPLGEPISNGTGAFIVYIAPGAATPLRRTITVDYDVVLEGKVEVSLDSGEARILNTGDVVIMRGTMHSWKNVTPDGGWVRLLGVTHDRVRSEIDGMIP